MQRKELLKTGWMSYSLKYWTLLLIYQTTFIFSSECLARYKITRGIYALISNYANNANNHAVFGKKSV